MVHRIGCARQPAVRARCGGDGIGDAGELHGGGTRPLHVRKGASGAGGWRAGAIPAPCGDFVAGIGGGGADGILAFIHRVGRARQPAVRAGCGGDEMGCRWQELEGDADGLRGLHVFQRAGEVGCGCAGAGVAPCGDFIASVRCRDACAVRATVHGIGGADDGAAFGGAGVGSDGVLRHRVADGERACDVGDGVVAVVGGLAAGNDVVEAFGGGVPTVAAVGRVGGGEYRLLIFAVDEAVVIHEVAAGVVPAGVRRAAVGAVVVAGGDGERRGGDGEHAVHVDGRVAGQWAIRGVDVLRATGDSTSHQPHLHRIGADVDAAGGVVHRRIHDVGGARHLA